MRDVAPVSVVIPCWRSVETIERAIASVYEQTWRPAEVIVVDDASGDDTLAKLRQLAACYPSGWIKVVELSVNGGPGLARNAGWNIASYPYVAFLDADDAWHKQKIDIQLNWMMRYPAVVLTAHLTTMIDEHQAQESISGNNFSAQPVSLTQMLVSNRFPTRSVMLKREIAKRFAGKEVTEDYLLWLQIVASGQLCVLIHLPLAFSFRAEFSPGGYSGRLWTHEKRELRCLTQLRNDRMIGKIRWFCASTWSCIKYVRRVMKMRTGIPA